MTTNQHPSRNSCWCRRTISRKRRRTKLRTTAPPSRRDVMKPARHGPQFFTSAVVSIRRSPRLVTPPRFTRSYSDRCVKRRVFGKENEPGGDISGGNFPIPDGRTSRATSQPVTTPHARCQYTRSLPPKVGGRLPKKMKPAVYAPGDSAGVSVVPAGDSVVAAGASVAAGLVSVVAGALVGAGVVAGATVSVFCSHATRRAAPARIQMYFFIIGDAYCFN